MKIAVVVDVQNDFVTGKLGDSSRVKIAENIKGFTRILRDNGFMIFATRDTHNKTVYNKDLPTNEGKVFDENGNFIEGPIDGYLASLEGKKLPIEHCIFESEGWKLYGNFNKDSSGNKIIYDGNIVNKPTFGSFELINYIRRVSMELNEEIEEIAIFGFCTSICVISNALMLRADNPNVPIYLINDLCGDINDESHAAALKVAENCQIDVVGQDVYYMGLIKNSVEEELPF